MRADATDNQFGRFTYTSVEEQQRHDGDEVLAILSVPAAVSANVDFSKLEDEAINWNLTEQQTLTMRGIMDELFPSGGPHVAPPPDHPLNLVPPVLSTSATSVSAIDLCDICICSCQYYG
jgi:hypothetical protein